MPGPPVRPAVLRVVAAGLLAGSLALGPVASPAFAGPPAEDFRFAAGLYQKERYADAARKFADFLAEHADHEFAKRAALFRGFSLYEDGEMAAARDALRAALTRPDDAPGDQDYAPSALLRIGLAETALNDPAAAVKALEKLRADYPADPLADAALLPLGKARQAAGDLPAAERAVRQYLNATANDADANPATLTDARRALGNILAEQGNADAAAAELRRAAAGQRPEADEALRDLGLLDYRRGQYREAADTFGELIDREPTRGLLTDGRINRGFALYRLNEDEAAAVDLRAAADLAAPEQAQLARLWAGRAAERAGDREAAAADYQIARSLAPEGRWVPDVLYRWGILLADSPKAEDRAAALAKFEQVRAADPQSPLAEAAAGESARLLIAQATAALRDGDPAPARQLVADALKLNPAAADEPRVAFLLTRLDEADLKTADDAPERRAIEARYAALAADQTAPASVRRDSALRRAESLRARGELADAIKGFLSVADSLKPGEDDAALRDALALAAAAARAAGELETAAEAGERFLDLFPNDPRAADVRAAMADAAAEAGDFDAALAAYEAARAAGRSPRTDRLAVRLADRAIAELEALPADAENRSDKRTALATTAADLVAPIAADANATDPELRADALNLLGWSNYHRDRFAEAADAYRTVVENLPQTEGFDEALTQLGVSLARTDDRDAAETALRTAWKQLAPAQPAPAGAESAGPLQDAWIAGLERARFLRSQPDRAEDAGEAYAELYEKFPNSRTGPLLWEWGTTLYAAERYADADAVYATLVEQAPDHAEADKALLILAESDLLASPPRPADAVRRLARLLSPANDEPITTDDKTAEGAVEPYLTALSAAGDPAAVVAAAGPLAERFPDTRAAAIARLLAAEARVRLAVEKPDEAADLRAAARDDLADARAALVSLNVPEQAADRPDWASRPWILGANEAFFAKDYEQVDRLVEELEAWRPAPPDLFEAREIHARRFKQQAPPDFDRAEELAASVVNDPLANGTAAWDRAQFLLADLALLRLPSASEEAAKKALLSKARDVYLNLNLNGSTDAVKALAGLKTGEMDEQLGDRELARKSYEEVLADFPDTPEAKAAAEKLAALKAD
ncbi:tetratricopeptide repeat protein [Alienimonas californiensis]|uniref:Tol-pal system protein YbgF n=1 Tax=Alienimonas californiensis TaxID=2527989 RepID=A0A517P4M2_9PLAN|nr:tetratricopeptide repeat protein [Alienimonas californiensis]QDT14311.1 tol-pal system protein YbgF [Alienimonas californiensis]